MLEAGVKFDDDYMSIQDGQTITARNELHIIIDSVQMLRSATNNMSRVTRVSGTGDSNN